MAGELTYWRCPQCEGAGKYPPHLDIECTGCAGTGNALRRHEKKDRKRVPVPFRELSRAALAASQESSEESSNE